ncbi:Nucleoside-diphosphate-sugar epimerase [Faunimonas pinastri]|uniref:Nucleoside-diphosphate-sugar epimerase n=1 Tax=Faunimonas pinastri TaxID=1855383 RepID=A0A1H9LVR8_9HYPH|nr:NAD(P)-dependent oxidoreductase [Faunimonas pinastri]SER15307.1 Nucleoside-diphosphate-sugar epimerase [Faunimonas pinastri]
MIAAVTGATGTIGQFITNRLLAEGVHVRAWRRPASDISLLPAAVEWLPGSLSDRQSARALVAGADLLIHAALEHVPGRFRGGEGTDPAGFIEANVGGSLNLMREARDAGVGRCVVLSSRAVFGAAPRTGSVADDASLSADTHYGAVKAAMEAFVQSWGLGEGWPVAALRPTGVYGLVNPVERSKWFDLVRNLLTEGKLPAPRAATEVHGDDVADAVWRLLTAPAGAVAGRAFNCSDGVVSTRDVVALVRELTGREGPLPEPGSPPANVMDCAGLHDLGLCFGGEPLLRETLARLIDAVRRA